MTRNSVENCHKALELVEKLRGGHACIEPQERSAAAPPRAEDMGVGMSTPTERRYRRESRYSTQLRVTVQPKTAAALAAEADAAGLSVSAVIRDALAAAGSGRPEEASERPTERRRRG